MIRTSTGFSRCSAGEWDVVYGTAKTSTRLQTRGVISCHGSGDKALDAVADPSQDGLLRGLGRHATVVAADLGGQTFANDLAVTRIGEAITYARNVWGVTGRVVLVGGSMGVANALAYTLAHPDDVLAVAGIIPLTSIADLMTRGAAADVNAAYGGAYSDTVHGPTHSPIRFAGNLPPALPIHLWSAPDDTLTPHAVTQAFVAARPQTVLTALPPGGHSDASVVHATPAVIDFVRSAFG